MPSFNVAVREHAYTGWFYSDVVQAESCEEALQVAAEHAAAPRPRPGPGPQQRSGVAMTGRTYTGRLGTGVVRAEPREEAQQPTAGQAAAPGPPPDPAPRRGFSVVVTEQAYAGRVHSAVVRAESCQDALQVAAGLAAAPGPSPGPKPQAEAGGRPRCADVWVYSVLHCELAAGHDPPHMALAGHERPVKWVRDDRGIAHALTDPATDAPAGSPITQPLPAREGGPPAAPLTGGGSLRGRRTT
jgi:hypothetical protein